MRGILGISQSCPLLKCACLAWLVERQRAPEELLSQIVSLEEMLPPAASLWSLSLASTRQLDSTRDLAQLLPHRELCTFSLEVGAGRELELVDQQGHQEVAL